MDNALGEMVAKIRKIAMQSAEFAHVMATRGFTWPEVQDRLEPLLNDPNLAGFCAEPGCDNPRGPNSPYCTEHTSEKLLATIRRNLGVTP